jgi:hypothetical protein
MLRSLGAEGEAWSCTLVGRQLSGLSQHVQSHARPGRADVVSRGVAAAEGRRRRRRGRMRR